jgi:hypothetical protein
MYNKYAVSTHTPLQKAQPTTHKETRVSTPSKIMHLQSNSYLIHKHVKHSASETWPLFLPSTETWLTVIDKRESVMQTIDLRSPRGIRH